MSINVRDLAYKDYLAGIKYPVIAEKHGVSLSTVKSWAKRHWKRATSQDDTATEQDGTATE